MSLQKSKKSTALRAGIVAAALTSGIFMATPAFAADGDIVGEATVTLDFTTADSVKVDIFTKNLSSVTAYGFATVKAPDGAVYRFNEHEYAAGATWNYSKVLPGYTCDDLTDVVAGAFGSRTRGGEAEWTSGRVSYPDSRVTVIGCDTPPVDPTDPPVDPTDPPVDPTDPPVEPSTPPVEPSTAPVTPPAAGGNNPAVKPAVTTPKSNVLPKSKTDGALLASNSSDNGTSTVVVGLAAMTLLLAGAGAGAVAIRRR